MNDPLSIHQSTARIRTSLCMLLGSLLLTSCATSAFTSSYTTTTHSVSGSNPTRRSVSLYVRPAPKLQFDLDKILAFEETLTQQQQAEEELLNSRLEKQPWDVDGDVDGDADDHISSDDETKAVDTRSETFVVPSNLHHKRLDAALVTLMGESASSRSYVGSLIQQGLVTVTITDADPTITSPTTTITTVTAKSYKVEEGQTLVVTHSNANNRPTEIVAQDLPLEILYEDEHMVVLNKAAGMVVHPAAGNWDGTVVNALAYYLPRSPHGAGELVNEDITAELEGLNANREGMDGEIVAFRPGIVHRLDKGTTGILIVAKTRPSLTALSASFANRQVRKTYLAITVGNPGKRVVINKPIGRHPIHRQRMRVVPDPTQKNSSGKSTEDKGNYKPGRRALSYVDTLAFDGKLSLVHVRIETGRTHQIRVHLQDRHTPVYGDELYGIAEWNNRLSKSYQISRPLLHAHQLEINHPVSGEKMVFIAPMAEDMTRIGDLVWPQGRTEQPAFFGSLEEGN